MRPVYVLALAAALCAQPLAAQAAPRIAHKPAAGRPYSAAVQVGDLFWFAGKVGNTAETQAMTAGRAAAEARNVMEAFKTLLAELGMDFGDVVQGTVYLVDIADYGDMNRVYGEYFPSDPPARETVAVKELVGGAAVEISFVAVKR
ncbi:MAG: Rid family hydrolase [Longimicrobiales bacterium]|nr:Rid family hydrolase [Longimicrobiales bacterium]